MFNKLLSFLKKEDKQMDENNEFSSEALERGIQPNKAVEDMTPEEIQAFQNSINPDEMGYFGMKEGIEDDEK